QHVQVIQIGRDVYLSTNDGASYTRSTEAFSSLFNGLSMMWDGLGTRPADDGTLRSVVKDGTPLTERIDGVQTRHLTVPRSNLGRVSSMTDLYLKSFDLWV